MEHVNPKRVLVAVVAACIAGMLVGSAVTFAVLQRSVSFPTSGLVVGVNVGVFADSACTQNLTSVSWGSVDPGESVGRTVYVKNTGNAPITLSMATVRLESCGCEWSDKHRLGPGGRFFESWVVDFGDVNA